MYAHDILPIMAKTIHVNSFASYCDEWAEAHPDVGPFDHPHGAGPGQDWMDVAPSWGEVRDTRYTRTVEGTINKMVEGYFKKMGWLLIPGEGYHPQSPGARGWRLTNLVERLATAGLTWSDESGRYSPGSVQEWLHYMVMLGLGSGVSWTDSHDDLADVPVRGIDGCSLIPDIEAPEYPANPEYWDTLPEPFNDGYNPHLPFDGAVLIELQSIPVDEWSDATVEAYAKAWVYGEVCMGQHDTVTEETPSYAEPGYDDPKLGVLFGNWNNVSRSIQDILESAGFALEWSDEWATCSSCCKAVRTQADSYSWTRSYVDGDGEILCEDCASFNPEETLSKFINDADRALTLDSINPESHGFVKIASGRDYRGEPDYSWANGWYGGQDASPSKIMRALHDLGADEVMFTIDSVGQFDLHFIAWARMYEVDGEDGETTRPSLPFDPNDPPWGGRSTRMDEDPAKTMERGLRNAAKASDRVPPGDGPVVATVHADGSATARRVAPEEFIAGHALDENSGYNHVTVGDETHTSKED